MSYARLTCLYRIAQLAMVAAILFAPGDVLRIMMAVLLVAGELFHHAYAVVEAAKLRQVKHNERSAIVHAVRSVRLPADQPQTREAQSDD